MKLAEDSLCQRQSLNEQLAEQLAAAGRALLAAAELLQGGRPAGLVPVAAGRPGLPTPCSWLTVTELVNEFLLAKARGNRSDRYLAQLRVSLRSFAAGRSRIAIDLVKAHEIEKWMHGNDWAPKTMFGYLGDVRTMFNYAVRRGYLDRNPAAGVETPAQETHSEIEIHTPDQVRQVLEAARRLDLDVCRHLAIRYFAGVRSAEAFRLRESDLKLDHGLIEVPALKAKTRSRRLVTIQPNLRAWLDLGGELRPMSPYTVYKLKLLSKVPWAHNVARHSFISYHVAQFKKVHETALEAGTSEQLVFSNYRALVTPAAAALFWGIYPEGKAIPPA